ARSKGRAISARWPPRAVETDRVLRGRETAPPCGAAVARERPVIRDYVTFLRATFSNAKSQLGDFGLQAPKARTPLPPEQRLAATAKATRVARGTVGKKKKLTVKGDVIGVTVTPITASGPPPRAGTAAAPRPRGAGARARGVPSGRTGRSDGPRIDHDRTRGRGQVGERPPGGVWHVHASSFARRAGHPPAFFSTSP